MTNICPDAFDEDATCDCHDCMVAAHARENAKHPKAPKTENDSDIQYRVFYTKPKDSDTEPDDVFYLNHESTPVHPDVAKHLPVSACRLEVFVMEEGVNPLPLRLYEFHGHWQEVWCYDNEDEYATMP